MPISRKILFSIMGDPLNSEEEFYHEIIKENGCAVFSSSCPWRMYKEQHFNRCTGIRKWRSGSGKNGDGWRRDTSERPELPCRGWDCRDDDVRLGAGTGRVRRTVQRHICIPAVCKDGVHLWWVRIKHRSHMDSKERHNKRWRYGICCDNG